MEANSRLLRVSCPWTKTGKKDNFNCVFTFLVSSSAAFIILGKIKRRTMGNNIINTCKTWTAHTETAPSITVSYACLCAWHTVNWHCAVGALVRCEGSGGAIVGGRGGVIMWGRGVIVRGRGWGVLVRRFTGRAWGGRVIVWGTGWGALVMRFTGRAWGGGVIVWGGGVIVWEVGWLCEGEDEVPWRGRWWGLQGGREGVGRLCEGKVIVWGVIVWGVVREGLGWGDCVRERVGSEGCGGVMVWGRGVMCEGGVGCEGCCGLIVWGRGVIAWVREGGVGWSWEGERWGDCVRERVGCEGCGGNLTRCLPWDS